MRNLPHKSIAVELYRTMLRVRTAEQRVARIYPSDKIQSPIHLSLGQEAVAAGVCRALRPTDHVYGTYRGHGLYIAKGGGLREFFAELFARETGCAHGKGGSMHLTAPDRGFMGSSAIVGSMIPVAVGDALASKMRKSRRVVVSFFGDGAVDEGVFFESVNFACLKDLPVLFVLENNGYAIHSRVGARHKVPELHQIARGLGLVGRRFDGNDVFKVFSETAKAVAVLRGGGAPRLLEFVTFRWAEHVGPASDLDAAYRRPGEARRAFRNDPLRIAERVLKKEFHVSSERLENWKRAVQQEVGRAVDFAEKSPFPVPARLTQDVFR